MLIFLDETGSDRRNLMSVNGLVDVRVVHGVTNGEACYSFTEECVLPQLIPFGGSSPYMREKHAWEEVCKTP